MKKILKKKGDGTTCAISIMIKGGKILTGHRHYTKNDWKEISVWTLPGGRSELGETIEQALRREVLEEVGITEFEIEHFIGQVPGVKEGDTVLMFYCTTQQEAQLMEIEKFSEWRWVPIDNYISGEAYSGFNSLARKMIVEYLLRLRDNH